jgi:hypothetical protein
MMEPDHLIGKQENEIMEPGHLISKRRSEMGIYW